VSLHSEADKGLWIGTAEAGVFLFDGRQAAPVPGLEALQGKAVWAMDGASDRALWLATMQGLYALKSGRLVEVIEGSDARGVVALKPGRPQEGRSQEGRSQEGRSQETAWCATAGDGLYKVLVDDEAGVIRARVDNEQGLPSLSVFAVLPVRAPTGEESLWIGTSRGLAHYEPGRVLPGLTATRVMGKRVFNPEEVRAGLDLEYPQNSLALDVSATSSRTFPEQFQYSFSLLDGSGNRVRQKLSRDSQFLMENLRPGGYVIEARAFTNDLVGSDPLRFEFNIASAPFPLTSVSLSVLLILALAAVGWGYLQNRRLERTNAALAGANSLLADTRLQLVNETEAERRRIARDLHDQTLADLRRLLLMTDQLPLSHNGHKTIEPAKFRAEIESISTEIRRICEDLSPSVLANVGLAAALEWALASTVANLQDGQRFEYEFTCDESIEEKLQLPSAVQIQIYRIAQEAVSNICRHSGATRVEMIAAIGQDGSFGIRIEDNGRGFDPKSRRSGQGLTSIRSRASLIKAEVAWSRRPEGGTLFALRKPPRGDAFGANHEPWP
ncbi:MAG TPA: ATP-binding protein, partial [Blastocatellia bacterium]|nr:ATP-binding protein [Blastocatellia bacterium]